MYFKYNFCLLYDANNKSLLRYYNEIIVDAVYLCVLLDSNTDKIHEIQLIVIIKYVNNIIYDQLIITIDQTTEFINPHSYMYVAVFLNKNIF